MCDLLNKSKCGSAEWQASCLGASCITHHKRARRKENMSLSKRQHVARFRERWANAIYLLFPHIIHNLPFCLIDTKISRKIKTKRGKSDSDSTTRRATIACSLLSLLPTSPHTTSAAFEKEPSAVNPQNFFPLGGGKKVGKKLRLWLCWWRMWNRTFWCSRGKKSLPLQPIAGRYVHLTRRSANRACVVSPQKEILFSKKESLGKKSGHKHQQVFFLFPTPNSRFYFEGFRRALACSSFFRNICFECRDGEAGSCGKSLERNTSRSSAVDREKTKSKTDFWEKEK